MLLAGEFDVSAVTPDRFLDQWDAELAQAESKGLPPHHRSFAVAFDRSFRHLSRDDQARLLTLARFPAPFFARGATMLWQALTSQPMPADETALSQAAREALDMLVRRSLLQVEGYYEDKQPATYRLEPVIARHLRRLEPDDYEARLRPAYLAYTDWYVGYAFNEIGSQPALAQLARRWLDELVALANHQPIERRAEFCRQVAFLLRHFGRLREVPDLLAAGYEAARQQADQPALSRLMAEEAAMQVVRGDLSKALSLYEETLQILEAVGDLKGKGATLHNLAQV
jgi:hypothetical protein